MNSDVKKLHRNHSIKSMIDENNPLSSTITFSSNKFMMYCSNHFSACLASMGRLLRSPMTTLMTLVVIGIALALPTSLFVLLENVKTISGNWHNNSQISLYLKSDLSPLQSQTLVNHLKNEPGVSSVKYISPVEGLAELENQTDLQNAIAALKENPLPGVILIAPTKNSQTPAALDKLLKNLQQLPQVDVAQVDMQWVKRLYAMIDLGRQIVYALGCLLGIGVLFIIGNTIHLNLQKYRREIQVFKLIGATNSFIRRPFLYTGILYGFFGSTFALLLVALLLLGLATPVHKLTDLYTSNFHLQGITFALIAKVIITGILLGLIGAWLAIGKHLRTV